MKPMGKWGTVGIGLNYGYMFGKDRGWKNAFYVVFWIQLLIH